MNTSELRKAAKCVFLATDDFSVAEALSDMLSGSAYEIDRLRNELNVAERLIDKNTDKGNVTKQDRMAKIVSDLQKYVTTYSDQPYYNTYSDKTFIEDMLYGIGIAINKEKYQNAEGYRLWKQELIKYMNNKTYDFSELTGKL